jgi:hypothetical protein
VLEKFTGIGDDGAAGANDDEWDTPESEHDDEPADGAGNHPTA